MRSFTFRLNAIICPDRSGGSFASATSDAEVLRHLDLGRDLLARGQLADALTHYHAAVGKSDICLGLERIVYF